MQHFSLANGEALRAIASRGEAPLGNALLGSATRGQALLGGARPGEVLPASALLRGASMRPATRSVAHQGHFYGLHEAMRRYARLRSAGRRRATRRNDAYCVAMRCGAFQGKVYA